MKKSRLSIDGSVVFSVASRPASPGNTLAVQSTDAGHLLGMDSTVRCNHPSVAWCGQSLRNKAVCKRQMQQGESLEWEQSWGQQGLTPMEK